MRSSARELLPCQHQQKLPQQVSLTQQPLLQASFLPIDLNLNQDLACLHALPAVAAALPSGAVVAAALHADAAVQNAEHSEPVVAAALHAVLAQV